MLGDASLAIGSWTDDLITVTVPGGAATGQLSIKRGGPNGKESVVGLTVHVGTLLNNNPPKKVNLAGSGGASKTIQAAIDAANPNDLITVAPGTYNEFVIMDKVVRLQGWGAGSVTINASKPSAGGLAAWRALIAKKIDARPDPLGTINPDTGTVTIVAGPNRTFDLLPGQTLGTNISNNEPILFPAEEAPGVLVVGRGIPNLLNPGQYLGCLSLGTRRIDGLTITGSDSGGGILASGFACDLEVANNRIVGNYGTFGGGVRVGHTTLVNEQVVNGNQVLDYTDGFNRNPHIHHNWVAQNGATEAGGGGGITLGTGSNNYNVFSNYICGNFSMADGGGMSHLGASLGTNTIARNKFIFNQTFNQSADPTGGGLFIGGQIPVGGGNSEGSGNVNVDANLFQGNQAGAGAGGGVSIARTDNGNAVRLTNNMIVNNVAAYAGGGIALAGNGTGVRLSNNTVASNVSTATNRQSFGPGGAQQPSLPQVAGIAVLDGSNPLLVNNIVWGNRSYIYLISGLQSGMFNPGTTNIASPNAIAQYRDLGRMVANGGNLAPVNSVLTTGGVNLRVAASPTNIFEPAASTTLFGKKNDFSSVVDPNQPVGLQDATVSLQSALTFDETGNFINVIFSPLTLWETAGANAGALRADYHLTSTSAAIDRGQAPTGSNSVPGLDFDSEIRPFGIAHDIGADEYMPRPSLALQPASIGYGNQSLNTTVTQTLTVSNIGVVPANLTAPTLAGTNANQFAFTNNCPAALDADASCTISVRFTPTSNGSKAATLTVSSSNVGTIVANLSGTGVTPVYTITPVQNNFGSQQVGTESAPVQFTLTNTALSQGELWLTGSPSVSGTNAGQFQAAYRAGDTCSASTHLGIGASCTFSVVFAPTSTGCKGTTVLGVCLTANTTVNVPKASGTGAGAGVLGTGAQGTVAFAAASLGNLATNNNVRTLAFGSRTGVVTSTITINNSGIGPVTYGTATVSNGNGTQFTKGAIDTCAGTTRNPGVTCQISVNFDGGAAGVSTNRTGTLTVPTGPVPNAATNNPALLSLTGN
jgi:hypothetical protein